MEYKFRGKRVDTGEWVYGYYVCDGKKHYITTGEDYGIEVLGADYSPELIEVLPETVGMWTGLKDKNGKDIYEGDIIKGTSYLYGYDLKNGKQFNYHGYVYWCDQCDVGLQWMVADMDLLRDKPKENYVGGSWTLRQTVHRNDIDYCTGKIIGNIHDKETK